LRDFFIGSGSVVQASTDNLFINEKFSSLLAANDFTDLSSFMCAPRENSYRDVKERLTVGLDLFENGNSQRVYLKRHWTEKNHSSKAPHKEAKAEFENIQLLKSTSIPVPEVVAAGWGYINKRPVGFVMLLEVPGLQADHFIETIRRDGMWPEVKVNFINKLAVLAALFHNLGFNHRDFYLCHFFVDQKFGVVNLHMIDLQRVQKRSLFRSRWIVKDLAQLCYSSLKLASRTDRLRFYLRYAGIEKLASSDRRLLKAIERKVATMIKRELEGKNR
jgi:hypothetical protein